MNEHAQPEECPQIYDAFCRFVDREDKLINQRSTVWISLNVVLFSASTFLEKEVDANQILMLSSIGLLFSGGTAITCLWAFHIQRQQEKVWLALKHRYPDFPSPFGAGSPNVWQSCLSPIVSGSFLMVLVWIYTAKNTLC